MLVVGGKESGGNIPKAGYIMDWIRRTVTHVSSLDVDVGLWGMACGYYKGAKAEEDRVVMTGGSQDVSSDSQYLENDIRLLNLETLTWTKFDGRSTTPNYGM